MMAALLLRGGGSGMYRIGEDALCETLGLLWCTALFLEFEHTLSNFYVDEALQN